MAAAAFGGDLSVWSAVPNRVRRLEIAGHRLYADPRCAWLLCSGRRGGPPPPLGRELTIPEVAAESWFLTRVSGRAFADAGGVRILAGFGATGATLAIHLAINALDSVVAELTPLYVARIAPRRHRRACELAERAAILRGHAWPRSRRRVAADPIERTANHLRGAKGWRRKDFAKAHSMNAAYQRRFLGPWRMSRIVPLRRLPLPLSRMLLQVPMMEKTDAMKMDKVIGKLAARLPRVRAGPCLARGRGPRRCRPDHARGGRRHSARPMPSSYDALVDPSILEAAEKAELHFAGKRGGKASAHQDDITANSPSSGWQMRASGFCRLKGGDPFVFGRGGEEAFALVQNGIPFRILPGLTAGLAGLAGAHIPATMRGINKAIILATGHAAGTEEDLGLGPHSPPPASRSSSIWA